MNLREMSLQINTGTTGTLCRTVLSRKQSVPREIMTTSDVSAPALQAPDPQPRAPSVQARSRSSKRRSLVALLVGVYWLASILTFVSERYVLPAIPIQKGPLVIQKGPLGIYPRHSRQPDGPARINPSHFRQPQEWGMSPYALVAFLARVTQGKPGILASKWLYAGLLGSYLLLAALVFLRLTQDTEDVSAPALQAPDSQPRGWSAYIRRK